MDAKIAQKERQKDIDGFLFGTIKGIGSPVLFQIGREIHGFVLGVDGILAAAVRADIAIEAIDGSMTVFTGCHIVLSID